MAHRDPETGQFVSDGGGGVSYSDHDVHHIRHEFFADEPNPDPLRDTQRFEITTRGLDPDEIAELRHMRIYVGTSFQYDGTENGPADVQYSVDAGYNLADGEFPSGVGETFDPDGDSTVEFRNFVGETDEVGQLYHEHDTLGGVLDDSTNGVGTGPEFRSGIVELPMADLYGSGPFVDSADDFVSSIRLKPNRVAGDLGIKLSYSLYYNVMETEDGRSRFGR